MDEEGGGALTHSKKFLVILAQFCFVQIGFYAESLREVLKQGYWPDFLKSHFKY